jgi:hypothetical protein
MKSLHIVHSGAPVSSFAAVRIVRISLRQEALEVPPQDLKVANVEVKQVNMPESMLRAMAKQAEAEREKRSKIIHAEGEFSAAQRLVDAANLLAQQPVSVQLRYLQTLTPRGGVRIENGLQAHVDLFPAGQQFVQLHLAYITRDMAPSVAR